MDKLINKVEKDVKKGKTDLKHALKDFKPLKKQDKINDKKLEKRKKK